MALYKVPGVIITPLILWISCTVILFRFLKRNIFYVVWLIFTNLIEFIKFEVQFLFAINLNHSHNTWRLHGEVRQNILLLLLNEIFMTAILWHVIWKKAFRYPPRKSSPNCRVQNLIVIYMRMALRQECLFCLHTYFISLSTIGTRLAV